MTDSAAGTERASEKLQFESALHRYQGALLRYVRGSLDEHEAQDVVQEVFLRLHKILKKNGLRDVGNIRTWLFRVAHNCTADALRRKSVDYRAKESISGEAERSAPPVGLEDLVHREDCQLVLKMLGKLPDRQKQLLLLKVEQGMTYREICEVTSLPLGTVGYLINQGLGTLARRLKAAGVI